VLTALKSVCKKLSPRKDQQANGGSNTYRAS
jgi:hypothetical protein